MDSPTDKESVFDKDIEAAFNTADIVFALRRIEVSIVALTGTVAVATGVLMLLAVKRA